MKLDQLTKKYPIVASLTIFVTMTVLTEAPIQSIRGVLAPVTGRLYGDYLTDLILNASGAICLLLAAAKVGLGGKLGLKKPRPWQSLLLTWPLVLLALLCGSDVFLGDAGLVFAPVLFVILACLYLAIGFFEEILFRGYVQGFLMRRWGHSYRGILLSVLVVCLIFCGAHLVNLVMGRSTLLYAAMQVVYTFFFGVYFSALYVRSGSLIPGIVLHTIFNFANNLGAFAPGAQPRSEMVRSATPEAAFTGILITLPLLLCGLFYLRKSRVQLPAADGPEG
ncbi:MAG: lysostaphin resistance A-like protein [Anaerolineae bacterium]|jgi:membrane protease YdiL (CAAX protease family)